MRQDSLGDSLPGRQNYGCKDARISVGPRTADFADRETCRFGDSREQATPVATSPVAIVGSSTRLQTAENRWLGARLRIDENVRRDGMHAGGTLVRTRPLQSR